jgi:hypothetical protein
MKIFEHSGTNNDRPITTGRISANVRSVHSPLAGAQSMRTDGITTAMRRRPHKAAPTDLGYSGYGLYVAAAAVKVRPSRLQSNARNVEFIRSASCPADMSISTCSDDNLKRVGIHDGEEHERSIHGPDADAQDQSPPSLKSGLHHTAGPYRRVKRFTSAMSERGPQFGL